jgi:formylglycine-generating enzyme required for sulfatase activity
MRQFVFIAHAGDDKPLLCPILDELGSKGILLWIDRPDEIGYSSEHVEQYFLRLHAGKPWEEERDEALGKSTLVLAVWSKHVVAKFKPRATKSGYQLRKEIVTGAAAGRLVCCRIDETPWKEYPLEFRREFKEPQTPLVRKNGKYDPTRLNLLVADIRRRLRDAFFHEYRDDRITEWSQDRYGAGDKLFTQLSLLLDRGTEHDERWDRRKEIYDSLSLVLEKNPEHRAFVLLGAPGSGKSTLLRHLDLEVAQQRFSRADAKTGEPFSYFLSLRDYRGTHTEPPPPPLVWLQQKWDSDWKKDNEHVQPIEYLLQEENSFLLLDAINEMPHANAEEYERLVDEWRAFIADVHSRRWGCRIVFSCRSLLYSNRLSTTEIMVPHVDILPLDRDTIRKFLDHYAPTKAETLFRKVEEARQLELYGTAYFLKMLVKVAGPTGEIPVDRAELLTAYIRGLLRREYLKPTDLIASPGPLSPDDVERLGALAHDNEGWRTPYELLEDSALFDRLGKLAFGMQTKGEATGQTDEHFQLTLEYRDALHELTPEAGTREQARDILEAACHLSLLEHDQKKNEVQFVHQLIQEYFAGRRVAAEPDPALVRAPWQADAVEERLPKNINEPLPPADSTGWEETFLFAALLTEAREKLVASLTEVNLPLAGRAAAQILASTAQRSATSGDAPRRGLSPELMARLRQELMKRMADSGADLRARIAAGKALGELGCPRFAGPRNAKGEHAHLIPPLTYIPAGRYCIGRDDPPHTYEAPRHEVELGGFHIALFPVTNAEWACFMRADSYEDPRWWITEASELWRKGDTTYAARTVQWYAFREMLKRNSDYLERKLATGELSPKAAQDHRKARDLSDEEFARAVETDFKGGRHLQPRRWRDRNFNNPLQPVVGICWYEALAYCAWLSAETGETWRLPTEAEWEAAARYGMPNDADYPWGDEFDSACCNTFESHIRATTPVGLYLPPAVALADCEHRILADVSGNAYEWTSSRYDKEKYRYPFQKEDGREELADTGDPRSYVPRVLRGGSWYYSKDEARLSFRLRFHPGYHNQSTGLRLVREKK